MSFGEKLAKLRKEKGWSQEELANKLNVSRQAVSKWESNNAYPETEKIVAICQLFNTSMDDLISLKELKEEKTENSKLKVVDSFIEKFINGIKLFYQMTFKQKLICLMEMGFYALMILFIYLVLIFILNYILDSILPIYDLQKIILGVITLFSFILGIYILIKAYMIRYLNYYVDIPKIIVQENKEISNKKEEKIIIRDSKSISPLSLIKKLFIYFCKFNAIIMVLLGSVTFVTSLMFSIFFLYYLKYGIVLLYLFLGLLGISIISYIIIEILIKFIFNIKQKFKKSFILFISTLILCSISGGLFMGEVSSFKILKYDVDDLTSTFSIPMDNNLVIENIEHYKSEIVYENRDDILIEVYTPNKEFFFVGKDYYEPILNNTKFIVRNFYVYDDYDERSINDYIYYMLNAIKDKKIYIYDYNYKMKIHISEENYLKLRENNQKYDIVNE